MEELLRIMHVFGGKKGEGAGVKVTVAYPSP